MNRNSESKASGSIRRNSPVNSPQSFHKFSEQFLKQRLKNKQMIQNRMKNLNTKLYSSQSDLIKHLPQKQNPQISLRDQVHVSRQFKFIEQKIEQQPIQMNQSAATILVNQLKKIYQQQISSIKRTNEMKLKALQQVISGKDKIIKQMQIQNKILKGQLGRMEQFFQSGNKW